MKRFIKIKENTNMIYALSEDEKNKAYLIENEKENLDAFMEIEALELRAKMRKLAEELATVEAARLRGQNGYSIDEIENFLSILTKV